MCNVERQVLVILKCAWEVENGFFLKAGISEPMKIISDYLVADDEKVLKNVWCSSLAWKYQCPEVLDGFFSCASLILFIFTLRLSHKQLNRLCSNERVTQHSLRRLQSFLICGFLMHTISWYALVAGTLLEGGGVSQMPETNTHQICAHYRDHQSFSYEHQPIHHPSHHHWCLWIWHELPNLDATDKL